MAVAERIRRRISCLNNLYEYLPIFKWLQNYGKFELLCDVIAGVSIALTIIPQSIAYAALMDLRPEYGLNSTFVGCILYSLVGTIKHVSIGPAAVLSVITLEYTYSLNGDFALLLTFLAGITEMLMGIFRLGFLVDFMSLPVSCGYITALAIMISCSQLKGLFGLQFKSKNFLDNIQKLVLNISNIKLGDTVVGVLCIVFLVFFKLLGLIKMKSESRINNNFTHKALWFLSISRIAMVVIVAIIIAAVFKSYYGNIPFEITGNVKEGLPSLRFPPISTTVDNKYYSFMDMVKQLNSAIIFVPFMSLITNIAIAKAHNHGSIIPANQELFALGFCNTFASFVGSLPVCGAITRSAIAQSSNVQSPINGLFTGIVSMVTLSIFTPYLNLIPRATLSAILISCVVFLIDWKVMIPMWKSDRKDLLVMISTIILTLTYGFAKGIFFSIMLSMLRLIYVWSSPKTTISTCLTVSGHQYIEITPDKGLYFPSVSNLRYLVLQQNENAPVVINSKNFTGLDFTAMKELDSLVIDFNEKGRKVILKNTSTKLKRKWNIINKSNTVLAFCNTNCDLDKLLFAHINKDKGVTKQDENKNKNEIIPLVENSCKSEVITESGTVPQH